MVWESSDYSVRGNWLHFMPVPVSPIYYLYDFWEPTGPSAKTWEYYIPDDDMVYSIVEYNHMANQITWLGSQIKLNDEVIWMHIGGEGQRWSPGPESAVRLQAGDKLEVVCTHVMAVLYKYYWQLDLWREPHT